MTVYAIIKLRPVAITDSPSPYPSQLISAPEQSRPARASVETDASSRQTISAQPQTIPDNLRQPQTIPDNLRQSQTTSDNPRQPQTIPDNLRQSQTTSVPQPASQISMPY